MTSQDQKQIVAQIREHLLPHCFNAAVRAGAAIMKIYKNRERNRKISDALKEICNKEDHKLMMHDRMVNLICSNSNFKISSSKEDEHESWTPVTVALNLTEITISLCSNIDVRTRPVRNDFCTGCVFCRF